MRPLRLINQEVMIMTNYQWIGYLNTGNGSPFSELDRYRTVTDAKDKLRDHYNREGNSKAVMTLYSYDDEAWADAKDFEDTGSPFDYPDVFLTISDRGGVKTEYT